MAEPIILKNQLGTPTIGLGLDFSVETAERYLGFFGENGLIEEGREKPILEILVAPGENMDLRDYSEKSYLRNFDGLGQLFEEYGIEPVVLMFFPNGSGAHMVSDDVEDRNLAFTYLCAGINIAKEIGAANIIGPCAVEHMQFKPFTIENAVRHLKDASDYAEARAGDKLTISIEALRSEESVLSEAEKVMDLIHKVGRKNIRLHGDLCHATAEGYGNLDAYIDCVSSVLGYLHVSRFEEWNTENNRAELTKGDDVGVQLLDVYKALYKNGLTVPTTVECVHYGLGGAIGRKSERLDAMQPPELDRLARKETLNSYIMLMETRDTAEDQLSAAKK